MSLIDHPPIYKPFHYPWAYEAWLTQQRIHWLPEEVPMAEDVKDWKTRMTEQERNLVTQILRFFTQSDIEVNGCYMKHYTQVFKPIEVLMMLSAFSNIETVHIAAYSHLIDTLGIPEVEYSAFMKYKEMKDKYEHWQEFDTSTPFNTALTMAVFGAFTEGLQLFGSFAILNNFQRFNKMKGLGQIITWSMRDETLHCNNVIKLYHTFLEENPNISTHKLYESIMEHLLRIIENEDAFIDLAFELGSVEGLSADEVKLYIRFLADRRLVQLGMDRHFRIEKNPLPWMDLVLSGHEHTDFFSNKVTEYSKASTTGDWDDAFSE